MSQKSYSQIFSTFEEICNNYKRSNQYFDILYDSVSSTIITKTPTAEDISVNTKKSGIVARTFTGTWNEFTFDEIASSKSIVKKIPTITNYGETLTEFEGWKLNKEIKVKQNPSDVPIDDKLQKIRYIHDYLMNYDDRIVNVRIKYIERVMERIFFNNEGCQLRQVIPRINFAAMPLAKEGSNADFDYYIKSGEIGFEFFDELDNSKLDQIAEQSLEMLNAELAPSGKHSVILDPQMTGLVAHESFGHGLEADQILRGRSYLKPLLNKKVASEICTICDTPTIENTIGTYFFDDEGIKADKNVLVENGILKDFIYDRRTASALNAIPKGNGRRESFAHPVHPRMTNTYFESGDYSLDEMISEIKYGVILVHGYYGMEDPLGGGMQNTSKKGYLIENGEKTKILKAVALTGSVLEVLNNIDAISRDKLAIDGGTCGKGDEDHIPVGSGGSYTRITEALISPG
ncbi:MAG: TldD/PmbA family protein [Candidatus Lokiarchaeota archaeon]|nr:TldD/PmbA family protein [Candidatus Lokiarchaeota archaeon]